MASHQELVAAAVNAVKQVNRQAVVSAFVGSLSTRNLPARSAFGSLAVLQKFKAHPFRGSDEENCEYCGLPEETDFEEDDERVENYPFQVQHTDIQYATFDLATFARREVDEPTEDDVECLRNMLDAIRGLPANAQLTQLNNSIAKSFKSKKEERMILLESFGYAGILCPAAKHHYTKRFVTWDESNADQPKEFFKREWEYPVRFWTGKDGVNEKLVKTWFGKHL